jgi:hypothetical protein
LELEVLGEQLPDPLRHLCVDLEAHRVPETALAETFLDRGQQIVGLVLLDFEVGVPRHAESVGLGDLEPGKKDRQVGQDELLEPQESVSSRRGPRSTGFPAGLGRW